MSEAVDQGLVRSIGVSNHSPEKIQAWFGNARVPVSVNQVCNIYSLAETASFNTNSRVHFSCRQITHCLLVSRPWPVHLGIAC